MPSLFEICPVVFEKMLKIWKVYIQTDGLTDGLMDGLTDGLMDRLSDDR